MAYPKVSDPKHPNYGKHLTKDEIAAQTNPGKEEIDKMCSFLDSRGVTYERHEGAVQATAPAKLVNEIFHTNIHKFTLPENDASSNDFVVRRTGNFTIPSEVAAVVSLVVGI